MRHTDHADSVVFACRWHHHKKKVYLIGSATSQSGLLNARFVTAYRLSIFLVIKLHRTRESVMSLVKKMSNPET
jgi:hypothetical protein